MKYNDLRQQTFDKLMITYQEAMNLDYLAKINGAFNEALRLIAQTLSCNSKEYKFKVTAPDLKRELILDMPPDFISFSEIDDSYIDNQPFIIDNFYGHNRMILTGNEAIGHTPRGLVEYRIFYNAFYPQIAVGIGNAYARQVVTDCNNTLTPSEHNNGWDIQDIPLTEYEFDVRIADLLPLFAASKCLIQDDRGLSIHYLNEFHLTMSQIDVSGYKRPRVYRSTKGLY